MLRRLSPLFIALAFVLTACLDDSDPGLLQVPLYDVAQLIATSADQSVFALGRDDSAPAILTADGVEIDTAKVKVGKSLYIRYVPISGVAYQSGPIILQGYSSITNLKLPVYTEKQLQGWDSQSVWLMSVWRSGTNIYLHLKLPYDEKPRRFVVAVDKSTLGTPVPQLYLVHQREQLTPTFDRGYYAAVDIAAVWQAPTTEGIDIHIANSNLPQSTFHFTK